MGTQNSSLKLGEKLVKKMYWQYHSLEVVGGHLSPHNTEMGAHRLCVRCAAILNRAIGIHSCNIRPHGTAEWLARVDRVR